mmetsp:Transcript_71714/g.226587  ORF Transcript_71714/g.226587 Transcript_71714/m.226587 type:complete len:470 (+) Transcript_71714:544-1953(+)
MIVHALHKGVGGDLARVRDDVLVENLMHAPLELRERVVLVVPDAHDRLDELAEEERIVGVVRVHILGAGGDASEVDIVVGKLLHAPGGEALAVDVDLDGDDVELRHGELGGGDAAVLEEAPELRHGDGEGLARAGVHAPRGEPCVVPVDHPQLRVVAKDQMRHRALGLLGVLLVCQQILDVDAHLRAPAPGAALARVVDGLVIGKLPVEDSPVFISESPRALLDVVGPVADVARPRGVGERALAVPLAVLELPLVAVLHEELDPLDGLQPHVLAGAVHLPVFPVPVVHFIGRAPVHHPAPTLLIALPLPLVRVAVGIGERAVALHHVILPLAIVEYPRGVLENPFALAHPVHPLSLIERARICEGELAMPMTLAPGDLSRVCAAGGPRPGTLPLDHVVDELPLVLDAITPLVAPHPMQAPKLEVPCVHVAPLEEEDPRARVLPVLVELALVPLHDDVEQRGLDHRQGWH